MTSLPPAYFDELYARSHDPWGFEDRWYERRKRALTLALLPDERYGSAYEPGCSIGVLTRELADRCDDLLASDVAPAAVEAARTRCAGLTNVTVVRARLPVGWPDRHFDLVVVSELGYYFDPPMTAVLAERAFGGADTVLAVHWRHPVHDYPQRGDEVHAAFGAAADEHGFGLVASYRDEDHRAEAWSRDLRGVAARTGVS